MYKKIAVTNRKLCDNLIKQLEILRSSDFDYVILREKDLSEGEYRKLAEKASDILGDKLILHYFINVCEDISCRRIHVPFLLFEEKFSELENYELRGVSVHSEEEAVKAESLGADYVTASHIFATDCKKGLEPKGIKWLEDVCRSVSIPVYALGGINEMNKDACIGAGAAGVCMMSEAMRYKGV